MKNFSITLAVALILGINIISCKKNQNSMNLNEVEKQDIHAVPMKTSSHFSSSTYHTNDSSVSVSVCKENNKQFYIIQTKYGDIVTMNFSENKIKSIDYLGKTTYKPNDYDDNSKKRQLTPFVYMHDIQSKHTFSFSKQGYSLGTEMHHIIFNKGGDIQSIEIKPPHANHDSILIFVSPTNTKWIMHKPN
jgi:hypothetical protein